MEKLTVLVYIVTAAGILSCLLGYLGGCLTYHSKVQKMAKAGDLMSALLIRRASGGRIHHSRATKAVEGWILASGRGLPVQVMAPGSTISPKPAQDTLEASERILDDVAGAGGTV